MLTTPTHRTAQGPNAKAALKAGVFGKEEVASDLFLRVEQWKLEAVRATSACACLGAALHSAREFSMCAFAPAAGCERLPHVIPDLSIYHLPAPPAQVLAALPEKGSRARVADAMDSEMAMLEECLFAFEECQALRRCGFLIQAFRVDCWWWEVYELVRRLVLTSILAFVQPRTASQVTVGVMVCFITLVLFGVLSPYAYDRPLFIGYAVRSALPQSCAELLRCAALRPCCVAAGSEGGAVQWRAEESGSSECMIMRMGPQPCA